METIGLTLATESLPVPLDRLFRMPEKVYRGMLAHGVFRAAEVALVDGLLVRAGTNGHGTYDALDTLDRMPLEVYENAVNWGLLASDDRIELFNGVSVAKMPGNPPHVAATKLVGRALDRVLPLDWHGGRESPVGLPSGPSGHASEPDPDVYVVRGDIRDGDAVPVVLDLLP